MTKEPNCHCCDGTGKELDPVKTGADMRKKRIAGRVGLRFLAKRLGISHTYLTLLEQGERRWNPTLVHDYLNEIGNEQILKKLHI